MELRDAKAQAELYLDLMGHDINNLNQIGMGFLELALETLSLDDRTKEMISKPLEALESSTRLIDNVRKLQRVKDKGLKLHAINAGDIIRAIMPRYSNIAGRDIKINFTEDRECLVWANDLLADVFSNIIGNTIKHSRGPLTTDIHLSSVNVDDKKYCIVKIEDNGPGIPDELKSTLFARYKKGYAKASGMGLGLYLVKTLVEDFHGEAWVEDRVQGDYTKGARFVVMLPAA
jgi:signal transduction histidine kinase